jgi:hypothetical protein
MESVVGVSRDSIERIRADENRMTVRQASQGESNKLDEVQ